MRISKVRISAALAVAALPLTIQPTARSASGPAEAGCPSVTADDPPAMPAAKAAAVKNRVVYGAGQIPQSIEPVDPKTDVGDPTTVQQVKADVLRDMATDRAVQHTSSDLHQRQVDANSSDRWRTSEGSLRKAWTGAGLQRVLQDYPEAFKKNAADARAPSLLDSKFTVTAWEGVQVDGSNATAVFLGHYSHNSVGPRRSGWFDQDDEQWQVTLQLVPGSGWLMSNRDASPPDAGHEPQRKSDPVALLGIAPSPTSGPNSSLKQTTCSGLPVKPRGNKVASNAAYGFNNSAAINYAQQYLTHYNTAQFNHFSDDCANFASQVLWAGNIPFVESYNSGSQSDIRNWYEIDGGSLYAYQFTVAKQFEAHFAQRSGFQALFQDPTAQYNSASIGDAIVFNSGNSSSGPIWAHVAIEHDFNGPTDQDIQHSIDVIEAWNTWYYDYDNSSTQQLYQRKYGELIAHVVGN